MPEVIQAASRSMRLAGVGHATPVPVGHVRGSRSAGKPPAVLRVVDLRNAPKIETPATPKSARLPVTRIHGTPTIFFIRPAAAQAGAFGVCRIHGTRTIFLIRLFRAYRGSNPLASSAQRSL